VFLVSPLSTEGAASFGSEEGMSLPENLAIGENGDVVDVEGEPAGGPDGSALAEEMDVGDGPREEQLWDSPSASRNRWAWILGGDHGAPPPSPTSLTTRCRPVQHR
jgi:hypothetical protein